MEASVAGGQQAGGDAGQAQQGQQGQGQDAGDVLARLDALAGGIGEMQSYLQSQPWQQQDGQQGGEQEQQDDGIDLSFLDAADPADPAYDPQQAAQAIQTAMQQAVQQAVQQQVTPLQEQQAEMRREREAEHLVAEIPDLADPETAERTVRAARELADSLGQPELANEPKFWRLAHFALQTAEQANTEGSDDPGAAHLEGGAGATQGGASRVDLGDAIVNASQGGRSVLPF